MPAKNGRCAMEHQISELKREFAFDVIPTRHYQGNSAHQQSSLLAYNLVRNIQLDTELVSQRKQTSKRTNLIEFNSLITNISVLPMIIPLVGGYYCS